MNRSILSRWRTIRYLPGLKQLLMLQHATTYTWLRELDLTNRLVLSHWTTTRRLPVLQQQLLMLQHAPIPAWVRNWI